MESVRWKAQVVIDPGRWIGFDFAAYDQDPLRTVDLTIDTDLYDISQEHEQAFARSIEAEIVDFLNHLKVGRVVMGWIKKRLSIIYPRGDIYVVLTSTRFSTTTRIFYHEPKEYREFLIAL